MTDPRSDASPPIPPNSAEHTVTDQPSTAAPKAAPKVRSMHADVAVWEGCGSCGAEPYWLELATDMGMAPETNKDDGQGASTDKHATQRLTSIAENGAKPNKADA